MFIDGEVQLPIHAYLLRHFLISRIKIARLRLDEPSEENLDRWIEVLQLDRGCLTPGRVFILRDLKRALDWKGIEAPPNGHIHRVTCEAFGLPQLIEKRQTY